MKNITKILIVILILILIAAGFLFLNNSITGNVIKETNNSNTYTYTKAICNSTNFCQDNEIICKDNNTISVTPITGAVIQYSENWQDPRNETQKEKLC